MANRKEMKNPSYTPQQINDQLPPSVGSGGDAKAQLICIMETLCLFTNAERGLTASQIADVIELRCGKRPSEQKVLSDIHAIADNAPFDMKIHIPSRGQTGGIRCEGSILSDEQIMVLINMVQTCKFATPTQRGELINALAQMAPVYQRDSLTEDVITDWRELPDTQDVFAAANMAANAIRLKKKMTFTYQAKTLDGSEPSIEEGPEGPKLEETPIALVYSFGNYYVETWAVRPNGKKAVWDRRLDRVRNPAISPNDAEDLDMRDDLLLQVEDKVAQTFDMFGDGIARTLFLKATRESAKYIYDRFGPRTRFHQRDKDGMYGMTCVVVQLGLTFYRWLFGLAGEVTIVQPPDELSLKPYWKDNSKAKKPYDQLMDDYEAALKGLHEQTNALMQSYGWGV